MSLVLALAGPLIGSKLVEFKQKGLDIFIAVDCSLSMQAEDFKPNRMAHAKLVSAPLDCTWGIEVTTNRMPV